MCVCGVRVSVCVSAFGSVSACVSVSVSVSVCNIYHSIASEAVVQRTKKKNECVYVYRYIIEARKLWKKTYESP